MLTENQYEMLGDRIAALYQALEQDVIADIARRVKRTGRFTETAELMAKAMMQTGKSPAQIRKEVMKLLRADAAYRKEVAANTKQYKRDTIHKIRQTEKAAAEMGNMLIAEAGDMSFNKDLWLWHQAGKELTKDSAFTRLVEAMAEQTAGELKNLTKTTGFQGVHGSIALMNAYQNTLDKALMKMTSGAFSFDRAAEDCVKELAHSGLRLIKYESGRSYQLDTASRMCLRTGSAQLSAKISMHNCDKTGVDLVEVDAHWGARPEHAEWQGKIYSRSGKHGKYPDFEVCRYGEVDGLCGVNCRHSFYPFFEGISEPNEWEPEPEPFEYRGKTYDYYQATQKQRKMEREVRATKREIEAAKAYGQDTKELNAELRRQISEYHAFSREAGIRPKDNRLRVVKGSSDLTKTNVYKTKKELEKQAENDKIKSSTEKPAKRKQLDTGFEAEIPDEHMSEYLNRGLQQIKIDTKFSDKEAKEFQQDLLRYFGDDYKTINALPDSDDTKRIIEGISRMPTYDGSVSRGLWVENDEVSSFTGLKKGDSVPSKNIIESWSSDDNVANSYAGLYSNRSSVILTCEKNITGVGTQHLSKFGKREAEVTVINPSYEVVEVVTEDKYAYLEKHINELSGSDKKYAQFYLMDEHEGNGDIVCRIKVKEKN